MLQQIELPRSRTLFLNKQVDQDSIGEITKQIIQINEEDENTKRLASLHYFEYTPQPIKLYIDSYGGSVYQCLGLLSVMEKSKTPLHTIVTGCAMSAGFMILICGHKRFGYRLSTPLYHQVSTGFWGTLKDMEAEIEETRRLQKVLEDIVLDRTKITKDKLKQVYDGKKDWFMSANEALKLGVVDEIIK